MTYKLVHPKTDIALRLIDERSEIDIMLCEDQIMSEGAKATVVLISDELSRIIKTESDLEIKEGDEVYFDPRMMIELKDLNLIVIDHKSLLIKEF